MVMRQARTQSAIMAEQYLTHFGSTDDEICTHKGFCDIAAIDNSDIAFDEETYKAAEEAIR